jgi:hypothetical protein
MSGLYFLLPTLLVIFISFLIVSAGAVALVITGMEEKQARFQALSAFSGTGFTTRAAESVVNHPRRRRIVSWLIILGNAGVVTVIVTSTSSLVTSKSHHLPFIPLILIVGILLIYRVGTNKGFIRRWEDFVRDRFVKTEVFEEADVEDLLHSDEGYGLLRVAVEKDSPLLGKPFSQFADGEKGISVLGIERGKKWIPVPGPEELASENDRLIIYGRLKTVKSELSRTRNTRTKST